MSTKLGSAISSAQELEDLQRDINNARSPGGFKPATLPAIMSTVAGVVALASVFKSDYEVHSSDHPVDMDWLVAAIVMKRADLHSERFPNRSSVDTFIKAVRTAKFDADNLPDGTKGKAELVKRADALITALYTPDAGGTLPLVTAALLNPSIKGCLAIVTGAKAAPILLTKETIWGKGGRAFFYSPVQASIIQVDGNGKVIASECRVAATSAAIQLSKLTKSTTGPAIIPWAIASNDPPTAMACGTTPVPASDSKSMGQGAAQTSNARQDDPNP